MEEANNSNHQEDYALVVAEEIQQLTQQIAERSGELRETEKELTAKKAELRIAEQEQELVRELSLINMLATRKMQEQEASPPRGYRMRVSDDTLQQILGLEDRIRLADKKAGELEGAGDTVAATMAKVEAGINEKQQRIEFIKETVGWERNKVGKSFTHEKNKFRVHQKRLTELEGKQNTAKSVTASLTRTIEELTAKLEEGKAIDEEIATAKTMLANKQRELGKINDEMKSVKRINQQKELMRTKTVDDYKSVKQIEGDKRVLHAELMRLLETRKSNEKSIIVQHERICRLQARLLSIADYVRKAFEDDDESEYASNLPEGTTEVLVTTFQNAQSDLQQARDRITVLDETLEHLDAIIERNIKKHEILSYALSSRTATAQRERSDKERDRECWRQYIESVEEEFTQQQGQLQAENEELRQIIQKLGHPGL